MEILIGVLAALVVAAFLGRNSSGAGVQPRPPAHPAGPAAGAGAREAADDAFVMGYVIGRHAEGNSRDPAGQPPIDAACGELDSYDCGDDWDDEF